MDPRVQDLSTFEKSLNNKRDVDEYLPTHLEALALYKRLELRPHPLCQGWFKEQHRSQVQVIRLCDNAQRQAVSSIMFLHDGKSLGSWRRVRDSEEIFFWIRGAPLALYILTNGGLLNKVVLGEILSDDRAEVYQHTVPPSSAFTTEVLDKDSYTLTACVVSPGWVEEDFDLVPQKELTDRYPEYSNDINRFF